MRRWAVIRWYFGEDDKLALGTHLRNRCIFGDFTRAGQHRPCDLDSEDAFLLRRGECLSGRHHRDRDGPTASMGGAERDHYTYGLRKAGMPEQ